MKGKRLPTAGHRRDPLSAGGGGAYWYLHVHRAHPDGRIRVSGNIETTEAQVAFKIAGRVEERLVDEGMMVKQGEKIATLDTADLRGQRGDARGGGPHRRGGAERVAGRLAGRGHCGGQGGLGEGRPRPGRPRGRLAAAGDCRRGGRRGRRRRRHEAARRRLRRSTTLFQRKTISAEDYDAARAAYEVAMEKHRQAVEQLKFVKEGPRKEQIEEARSALAQAKAQYDLVMAGPRREDIDQGRARLEQAQAALRLAQTQLSYATVYSPLTGVVLSKNIEPGEYVAPGTAVVTVGDLVHVWLRAYIEEDDLKRVKLGQKAVVTTDSTRQTVPGPRLVHRPGGRVHAEERADAEGAREARLSHQDRHHQSEDGTQAGHAGRRGD